MKHILICWIGNTDLRAPEEASVIGLGPIAQALDARPFDEAVLVTDYPEWKVRPYLRWLQGRTKTPLQVLYEKLSGPTQFGEIYEAAVRACVDALDRHSKKAHLTFHLSPGTPAMAAVWIILSKTRFPAELIESSKDHGVKTASVPFDISAEFVPDLLRSPDERLRLASEEKPVETAGFEDIIHRSGVMARLVDRARRAAVRNIPVLLEGESGTGKELFARAIHRASPRHQEAFISVNCGAIPHGLVESELFGHEKGAFTGADRMRRGHFEMAEGGTLFLDEIGELPNEVQVRLLRVLQEGEVVHVGSSKPIKVDVRIIAATNRNLIEAVAEGHFREDLFYRLAVAYLKLPPLRERAGDLNTLINHLLERINRESEEEPGFKHKTISSNARNLLLNHRWPGNVRELQNTLRRAALWSAGDVLRAEDIRDALLPPFGSQQEGVLNRPLGEGFSLSDAIGEVARHYLYRALEESKGTKKEAAGLLGFSNYQTLSNWLKKYGIKAGT